MRLEKTSPTIFLKLVYFIGKNAPDRLGIVPIAEFYQNMPKNDQIERKTAKMGKKGPNGKSNCRQRGQK